MQTISKQIEHQCLFSVLLQMYCGLMTWEMETKGDPILQILVSTGSLRRYWFCPVWNKIRHQIVIFLDITSGYVRKWCGCSFLTLCMIAQCEAFKICAVEPDLFFFHYDCWEHPQFWWVQGSVTNNMEWCKYILYPFRTRFIDHIFPSWNFWVSLSSAKVKGKVWSVSLEPGFSPSGTSRGMGGIPSFSILARFTAACPDISPQQPGSHAGLCVHYNVHSTSVVQMQEHLLMLEYEYY